MIKYRGPAYYILKGKLAVPCKDAMAWARWYETADRHVARDKIGGITVSTVFLGLDHNFMGGLPLIFETMALDPNFGGLDQERCGTWEEAEAQHARMVEKMRRAIREKVND